MDKKIPYSGGPKRLAFQIRKFRNYGSTSLLIRNRFGVWSAVRCRHVKKSRYLRFLKLKADAGKLETEYVKLRKLGANDEKVTFLRRRLADFYWDAAPARYKEDVVDYFREIRRNRWSLRIDAFLAAALIVVVPIFVLCGGAYLWFNFGYVLAAVNCIYELGVNLWRHMSDYADNKVVQLLDQLACRRVKRSV